MSKKKKPAAAGQSTLGAVAQNERGENGILSRTGKYAVQRGDLDRKHGIVATCDSFRKAGEPVEGASSTGTSIFDPVLCELCYKWFIPVGGSIFDPFAGGSVRGIVAVTLGHAYTGIDLSARQLAANEEQAAEICGELKPRWIRGDSRNLLTLLDEGKGVEKRDFVFACPPYFDLEVYSDDKADLSVCSWEEFCESYNHIIASAASLLKPNRFAVFVIGDVRDEKGFFRGLPQLTIDCFARAGMKLYNMAVLVTSAGSLPIRAGKQFAAGRKLGSTHQYVLCFFNGDPRKIKDEFPKLDGFSHEAEIAAEAAVEEPELAAPAEAPAAAPAPAAPEPAKPAAKVQADPSHLDDKWKGNWWDK